MSYLRTVGEVGAEAWEAVAGSAGSARADSTNDNCVPCLGEKGLARGFGVSQGRAHVFSLMEDGDVNG